MDASLPWNWSPDAIRQLGYQVVDLIAKHLTELPNSPVFRPFPPELVAEFLHAPAPADGQSAKAILDEFDAKVRSFPLGQGHPRFWGWVNPPPTLIGIFADALAAAMNTSCSLGNHGPIYVERQVLHWMKEWVGFRESSAGLLVSGGSMATLTALAAARHVKSGINVRAAGLQGLDRRLTVYISQEAHGCIRKAVELLGLGSDFLRTIAVDDDYRMIVPELDAAIRRDLDEGHRPMAVVGTAGTVNTGAIDPLAEIAAVCRKHDVWCHVDAAYGGPAILTERYRPELEAMREADSLTLDPHKWFYIPVEAGLVLVKDAASLRDTFSLVPPYLRTDGSPTGFAGLPAFSEFGFQLTRGFRALKVWMALKHHGRNGYRKLIDHDLALAGRLAARVRESADLELMAPSSLSIVCFRYVPAALRGDEEKLDAFNQRILNAIQLGGEAFLSSTVLKGRFVLRACIVNPRSSEKDIDFLVDLVCATGKRFEAS